MQHVRNAIAGGTLFFLASSAFGADIIVGGVNGDVAISAKNLAGQVFGGEAPPNFANQVLADIHSDVHPQVSTENRITILALHTDSGLGLFVLVDREQQGATGGANLDSALGFVATGSQGNMAWVNDNGGDLTTIDAAPTAIGGVFKWENTDRGDAFAFSDLMNGDEGTLTFTSDPIDGVNNPDSLDSDGLTLGTGSVQILSWDDVNMTWYVAGTNDLEYNGDTLGMDWAVIPLPAPIAMGMAGVCGLMMVRRRGS